MKKNKSVYTIVISALLCALGLLIPMIFPRITLEPMSFTLASHLPVFLAIFVSPIVAVAVTIATTIGFFFTATPVIAFRALSHIGFVIVAILILKAKPTTLQKPLSCILFGVILAAVHAVLETAVVTIFYFSGVLTENWHKNGFLTSVLLLVGVGTFIHSLVDYFLAIAVWKPVQSIIPIEVSAPMKSKKNEEEPVA